MPNKGHENKLFSLGKEDTIIISSGVVSFRDGAKNSLLSFAGPLTSLLLLSSVMMIYRKPANGMLDLREGHLYKAIQQITPLHIMNVQSTKRPVLILIGSETGFHSIVMPL